MDSKHIKIDTGVTSLFFIALFILFLNWVLPAFVPAWVVTIAFWYIIFNIVILLAVGLIILIIIFVGALLS